DGAAMGLVLARREREEPLRPAASRSRLDVEALCALLAPGGPFARHFPGYEHRPQQIQMLAAVAEHFNEGGVLVVEAGTGTGKSLAYLLPAVVWALTHNQRVVVSTYTLTLQQQLLEHDLPRLQQALNSLSSETDHPLFRLLPQERLRSLKVALAKGRINYLCLRKWHSLQPEKNAYGTEQKSFFIRLLSWLQQTVSGDRRELNLSDHQPCWPLVASEAESCWGRKCPHFQERCFFMRARRQWEAADILVTNHALLLSDLNAESKVLPAYDRLIIDEAHHLEDLASEHLGVQVRETALCSFLRKFSQAGPANPSGWLPELQRQLNHCSWGAEEEEVDNQTLTSALELIEECQRIAEVSWNGLKDYVKSRQNGNDWFSRQYLRLLPEQRLERGWEAVELKFQDLLDCLQRLLLLLENLEYRLQMGEGEANELKGPIAAGKKMVAELKQILSLENRDWVYWIELEERHPGQIATFKSSPVDVGEFLNAYLFTPKKTVILTSATLTVENSFSYFMERVGLSFSNDRISTMQLDSPFTFEKQVMLCVLRGLPDPTQVGDLEYAAAVAPVIIDLVKTARGRTLVLFTSNKLLRETYFQIKDSLEQEDIVVMAQNIDGGQSRLLEEFRETPQSVILGSSGLWEGIDIPGEALSCVVIVRLPFSTPNLPLAEARIESLQRQKRNAFYSYSMPQAIIRLKQGFGRLIRTQNDRGVVVILDSRVIDRPYGRRFLHALPINQHLRGELPDIKKRIANWLENRSGP
ncbi:MAG: helicase C-terminal domain-containing protein, partial [Syntrophomonadaceae bacterium]|nr:helicase C-terminal domain-containing protein [Syntrophomonadaceae bacterium]